MISSCRALAFEAKSVNRIPILHLSCHLSSGQLSSWMVDSILLRSLREQLTLPFFFGKGLEKVLLMEGDISVCTFSYSRRDTTSQVPSVPLQFAVVKSSLITCTTTESEHLCSSLSLLLPFWRWEKQNSTSVDLSGWQPVDIQQLKSALPTLQTKTLRLHGMILWYVINWSKSSL